MERTKPCKASLPLSPTILAEVGDLCGRIEPGWPQVAETEIVAATTEIIVAIEKEADSGHIWERLAVVAGCHDKS